MCGIFGVVNLDGQEPIQPEILESMGNLIIHRGPDDAGAFVDGSAGIGMRRLSIIDVSGGHQPISNEDRTVWVVCNGEIYNYQALRTELENRGHRFQCESDTEVIVHLYEDYGDLLVTKLRGMFAFALWDSRHRRLLVSRDRMGIKPLYFHQDGRQLSFASEIKALLANPSLNREVDTHALGDYLSWGYVPAPRTLFKGISKLLPAHSLIVDGGRIRTEQYWELRFDRVERLPEEEWAEAIREKLRETIQSHLISDVPLGAFLSGGLDSSSIVSIMSALSDRPVKTFSIGFGEGDEYYNELPYAKIVADACHTEHHEILVRPNVFELFPRLIWHLDEPIADSAFVTTYLVSEFARQSVTVILSGVGGDELFGGYRRYLGNEVAKYYDQFPRWARQTIFPKLFQHLPTDRHSPLLNYFRLAKAVVDSNDLSAADRYLQYISVFNAAAQESLLSPEVAGSLRNEQTPAVLPSHLRSGTSGDMRNRMMELDLKTQLPDDLLALTDKMSMAASLECRVPFLDHEFVELAARVPPELKIKKLEMKYILKKALRPILPPKILNRKKRGFGAPVGAWLRRDLRGLSQDILSERNINQRGYLQWPAVAQTLNEHLSGQTDHTDRLLALINFELWCRIYLDRTGPGASLSDRPRAATVPVSTGVTLQ